MDKAKMEERLEWLEKVKPEDTAPVNPQWVLLEVMKALHEKIKGLEAKIVN